MRNRANRNQIHARFGVGPHVRQRDAAGSFGQRAAIRRFVLVDDGDGAT